MLSHWKNDRQSARSFVAKRTRDDCKRSLNSAGTREENDETVVFPSERNFEKASDGADGEMSSEFCAPTCHDGFNPNSLCKGILSWGPCWGQHFSPASSTSKNGTEAEEDEDERRITIENAFAAHSRPVLPARLMNASNIHDAT